MEIQLSGWIRKYMHEHNRGMAFSLFAIVLIVYLPFLHNPFVFDDLPFFSKNSANDFAGSFFNFNLRWLSYASIGWTWAFFIEDTFYFHLGNSLLHALNTVLLFYLLQQIVLNHIQKKLDIGSATYGAWLGALVFGAHPVATYAAGYMIQRSILMAVMFGLLMQLAYLKALLGGQKRWLILSVIAYFFAVFAKEHSVMLPAAVAAETVLFWPQRRVSIIALFGTWGAFTIVAILIILRAKGVFGVPYEPMAAMLFEQRGMKETSLTLHLLSVITQAGLYFKYLLMWLIPNPALMSIDMREAFVASWNQWQAWLDPLMFMLYGAVAVKLLLRRGRPGLAGLALLYPLLMFLIEFSTIRVQEPFVLYRSYFWIPGLMLLIPLIVSKFQSKLLYVSAGCIILILIGLSWSRLWILGDNYRLWNDAAVLLKTGKEPGADRIYYNRGQSSIESKNWQEVSEDMQRVYSLNPEIYQAIYWNGIALMNMEKYQEAIVQFKQATLVKHDDAQSYYALAIAYKRMHQEMESAYAMRMACERNHIVACMIVNGMKEKK